MPTRLVRSAIYFFVALTAAESWGWGLTAHQMITDRAIRLLPTRVGPFYWENRKVLAELSIDPDVRKEWDWTEGPKHYIDLERYPADPPRSLESAMDRFSRDTFAKGGWVPWHTQDVYRKLVDAYRKKDYPEILRLSGDLSHYVADMHIPLHTTENHDGQLSIDTGVHSRFESKLVDLYPDVLPFTPAPPEYISDVTDRIWRIIGESWRGIDSVLEQDRKNRAGGGATDGYDLIKARQTHGPLAARRMNDASRAVASFWYSAWIDAVRPRLAFADFSALAMPRPPPKGERLYYEGRYVEDLPEDWPMEIRKAFHEVADWLKNYSPIRVAEISWVDSRGEFRMSISGKERTGPANEKEIQVQINKLLPDIRVRVRID